MEKLLEKAMDFFVESIDFLGGLKDLNFLIWRAGFYYLIIFNLLLWFARSKLSVSSLVKIDFLG